MKIIFPYLPSLVGMILIVGELVLNPLVDLPECEVAILFAAYGHLNEVHVAVRGTFIPSTLCTYLKYNNMLVYNHINVIQVRLHLSIILLQVADQNLYSTWNKHGGDKMK